MRNFKWLHSCIPLCLMVVILSAMYPAPGVGCTCMAPPGIVTMRGLAEWYSDQSKLIFEGQVERQDVKAGSIGAPKTAMSMTPNGAHRVVTIRSLRVYRGPSQETFTVLTGMGLGDCGFDFEAGRKYLVYADPIDGGAFFTSICAGTGLLEHSGPALRLLRKEPPSPEDLLDGGSYLEQMAPKWTGTVCGQVSRPDGNPLDKAMIDVWQVRDDPFPPYRDGDLSAADGTFCVKSVPPGRYLLTAETEDFDNGTRLMGFYPGVWKHADAATIEVKAEATVKGLRFATRQEAIYTVRFRIVTADGSPVPWKNLGVAIDSPDRDPLAYHENHGVNEDGSYALGGIPAGHYVVSSYFTPDPGTWQMSPVASKWQRANKEVDIVGPTEVILTLSPGEGWSRYRLTGGLLLAGFVLAGGAVAVRYAPDFWAPCLCTKTRDKTFVQGFAAGLK
jgi:hypothetical protein